MSYSEQARAMRPLIVEAAQGYDDAVALTVPYMFDRWETGVEYTAGYRVRYGQKLYKVLQAHTSQADWTPDTAVSLYVEVTPPGVIPLWKQPTGSTDAYMTGDKVRYPDENGPIYICTMDYNVYAPDIYGWDLVE